MKKNLETTPITELLDDRPLKDKCLDGIVLSYIKFLRASNKRKIVLALDEGITFKDKFDSYMRNFDELPYRQLEYYREIEEYENKHKEYKNGI